MITNSAMYQPSPLSDPVVFAGPSISANEVKQVLPQATVLPPVARGDLQRAREEGGRIFLIIDGTFSHKLAIAPSEVVDVIRDGALVLGSSSMGAIRAAECGVAGMWGVGVVFLLYRLGVLHSDDEVAVATDPEDGYRAVSLALVNVRYAVRRAVLADLISSADADAIVGAAKEIHFLQRQWPLILRRTGIGGDHHRIRNFCGGVDVKHEDALRALRRLALLLDSPTAPRPCAYGGRSIKRPSRYIGHDPHLGRPLASLPNELTAWLLGSGRYQRYLWPLVTGEPEFRDLDIPAEQRPEVMRERLAMAMARLLEDTTTLAVRLWHELTFLAELEAELMNWHALRRAADSMPNTVPSPASVLTRVREEVAIAHGYDDWSSLKQDVTNGRLFNAIPMEWVDQACMITARARVKNLRVEEDAS